MKNSYTTIYFNDIKLSKVFNATLSEGFYEEELFGSKSIIEQQIPGRDAPYFYGVSRDPLEFEVTLGFTEKLDIYQIKQYVEMFYVPDMYLPISFEREDGFMTPTYYVICIEMPTVQYLRDSTSKYFGAITLSLRANAPYGYEEGQIIWENQEKTYDISLSSVSMPSTNYVMKLTNNRKEDIDNFYIKNSDESVFALRKFYAGETVTIDGRNRRITAQMPENSTEIRRETPIYEDWNRQFMNFIPNMNELTRYNIIDETTNEADVSIDIIYRLPRLF